MSRVRAHQPACRLKARTGALLLAASIAALCAVGPANAQDLGGLRGELSEAEVNSQLYETLLPARRRTEDDTIRNGRSPTTANPSATGTLPAYEPASPGGLTAAEERRLRASTQPPSIFDEEQDPEEQADDPFAEASTVGADRELGSARQRAQARRDRLNRVNERAQAPNTRQGRESGATAAQRREPGNTDDTDEEATGAIVKEATAGAIDQQEQILDEGSERERAIQGRLLDGEDNPYQALGIRAGDFILRPSFEQGMTVTSNVNSSAAGGSAVLSESTLRLNAISDWSENLATFDGYAIYRKSISGEDYEEREIGFDSALEYQLSNEYRLLASLGYSMEPESASSPDAIADVVSQPDKHLLDGTIGVSKDIGKLRLGVTGKAQREWYGDAELETGEELDQSDRNSTVGTLALRAGYEISPAIRPFVEVEGGRRAFDDEEDTGGYRRSSDIFAARAGVEFDRGEKLNGEFSAGWLRDSFDDERLEDISGATVNANVRWSPERGTIISLNGSTSVDTSTVGGESGSLLYSTQLAVERQIRANLTGNAALGLSYRDYAGSGEYDTTYTAEAGATWWLNRYLGLTTRVRHENLKSSIEGRDYETNSIFGGIKVQR